jgi:PAS domain S-box-containing protein
LPHTITLPPDSSVQHDLIDAAVAVNEAPTLRNAFQVLAETGLALLAADYLWVVVWSDDLATGEVVAGAGKAADRIGEQVASDAHLIESVATGKPFAGPPILDGLSPEVVAKYRDISTIVRVPLLTESCRASFHAAWDAPQSDAEASDAALLLHTLTRLTTLAERTLREREQDRLENVLEGVAEGVVFRSGDQITLNAAGRAIFAVPAEAAELRNAMFNLRALDGSPYGNGPDQGPGQIALRSGGTNRFTIRATALDGRELVLDCSVSPAGSGVVIVFRDVTDAHLRNQLNQETLNALFDAMPTAISVTRPDSQEIVAVNRAFCELIGRTAGEIVGLRPPFPWWGEHEPDADPRVAADRSIDRVYRRPDGRPFPARLWVRSIPGDDGETALVLTLIEDLAEDRRIQQQLVQSGKLAAIGELAAGVAHEINNPLFAILGLTEFLLMESEAGSKAHTRLQLIQQTGLEIKQIVRALLDFARENDEERQVVSLEDVVRSTVELVRRTNAHKGVELVDTYDASGVCVDGSPNQLKQIFLNLITNARQAMPSAGGVVSIDVRREGALAIASVADDGPGIEPAAVERIFEPFFTTKRPMGGTGLGLSVSLGIAEAHGGRLTAASELGVGSTFTLCLPAYEGGPQ